MPQLIAALNSVIAVAFFMIFSLIVAGLIRDRVLGVNPLGIATAAVFLTCAAGHAIHAEHYFFAPELYAGYDDLWHQAVFDAFTVAAGIGYLAQRRRFGMVIRGSHPMLDYQRQLQTAEALRDVGLGIASETDVNKLLLRVARHARDLLGADYVAIVDQARSGKVHCQVAGVRTVGWDEADWTEAVFLAQNSRPRSLKPVGRPVVVEDMEAVAPLAQGVQRIHEAEGGRSVMALPVFSGDAVVGSLMAAYRSPRWITQDDLSSAAALASQAAVALEKARLIESLHEADRLKDEFISAAAHELKTPVTAIKGWAEMILRSDVERLDQRKAIETIHRQAERIARLSEDLLAAARLQPGAPILRREKFDLGELSREAVNLARRVNDRREFRVSTSGTLLIDADRQLIAEMLSRLLENAVRYSPQGETVDLVASQLDGEAVVSITDHGVGVPSNRRAHIFEPFYEPVPSGQEGYVGIVSLGLHLSKQIVEAHGGRIWFNSGEEGSTFSFGFPLAQGSRERRVAP